MPIQAVLFKKKKYTTTEARKYLKNNDMNPIKRVHITQNYLRYRLQPPELFNKFKMKKKGNNILYVIGWK